MKSSDKKLITHKIKSIQNKGRVDVSKNKTFICVIIFPFLSNRSQWRRWIKNRIISSFLLISKNTTKMVEKQVKKRKSTTSRLIDWLPAVCCSSSSLGCPNVLQRPWTVHRRPVRIHSPWVQTCVRNTAYTRGHRRVSWRWPSRVVCCRDCTWSTPCATCGLRPATLRRRTLAACTWDRLQWTWLVRFGCRVSNL